MDVLSFTTIILILFITIGAYLIFTNQIEGRAKIIIIVAVFICFIYIFMNLNVFKSYTETKSSPVDASALQTVTKVDTTATSFSLSTWIYITDWNSGKSKTLFSMANDNGIYNPTITIGPYTNELVIKYYTTPSTAENTAYLTLNTLYTAYTTAKNAWIAASNAERDNKTGWYFSAATGTPLVGTPIPTSPTVASNGTVNADLAAVTTAALTALTNARRTYDGGSVGTTSADNTIIKASSQTTTTVNGTTTYTFNTATVTDDTSSKLGTGGGLATYNAATKSAQVTWTGTGDGNYSLETIRIPEISIQKWVNIVVSFGDNTVDTYINGKLVDSHVSTGSVQVVTTTAKNSTLSWGGYTGYISASRYYPQFLTPQEAWNIYKEGFSDNLMGNFLNQYNAKFTFSQNQVEKASFNII